MSKVACICEGNAERAIIDLLLDHDCLIFSREEMLEEEVLMTRSAKEFQRRHLSMTMQEKITVYRVLDSGKEKFNITGPFKHKIDRVVNVITAPEIEMLVIHAEDRYEDFQRKRPIKPSAYVIQYLGIKDIKSYQRVMSYFSDVDKLKMAIEEYHSKTSKKDDTIYERIMKK